VSKISIVSLLSYDYLYAFESIAKFYDIADEIILGLDMDKISWSGNKFAFDEFAVDEFIKKIDVDDKIMLVKENFHILPRPMDNETAERNHLSQICKKGNWIIQIDSDEIMLNKMEFKQFLEENEEALDGCALKAHWITVFKIFEGGKFLVIDADGATDGKIFVGTKMQNSYTVARTTDETAIQTPLRLLHISWGRTREELKNKLENWGHSKDFDTNAFLDLWDKVTLDNYHTFTNIHPLHGPHWPKLKLVDANQIMTQQGEPNEI
jgi:hypothetical protein